MTEIWICEDDPNLENLIMIYLKNIGFSVKNILKSKPTQENTCDLLIIDYELFTINPIDIIYEFKKLNQNAFIVLLAKSFPYDLGYNSLGGSINKLLIKPINLIDIEKVIINSFLVRKEYNFGSIVNESFLDYIIAEINNEFRFINTLLKDNNINSNYFDLLVFSKSNRQFNNVKICETLEDFFEILLLISSSTYELILEKIQGILIKFELLFASDKQFIVRIENLKNYFKAFTHFVNLEMYDAIQICFEMDKYYSSQKNTKMIIRTKSMITTCYSYIGLFDKSIQRFNELYSMNFINLETKLLYRRFINIVLKRHFKVLILIDEPKEYMKLLNEFALLNESFLENNTYFDSVYSNSKLNYITYYGNLQIGELLANYILRELTQNPISINNRLIFDILLEYYLYKGSSKKFEFIFNQYSIYYNYYKKEYYLYNLNVHYAYFLLFNEEITKSGAIFKSYQKILINPERNCIVYQDLFIRYLHYLLLIGDFIRFNDLFKILFANYQTAGIKGPKLFLLLDAKIHYSVVYNEIFYPIITSEIIEYNELHSNDKSFYSISNKYLKILANINEKGFNKVYFEQLLALFYFSIDSSQFYLAKTILVICFELVIKEFFDSNYFNSYFIEIINAYEHNIEILKEFKLYYDYIKCLTLIIKDFMFGQENVGSEIESILDLFRNKEIMFLSKNINNFKSRMLKIEDKIEVIENLNIPENQFDYSILLQNITGLFKESNKNNLGIIETAILLILFNYQKLTRTQIASELSQNHSSIRYNIGKLLNDKLIDYDVSRKTNSEIRKSSHKYFLTNKGLVYVKELLNDIKSSNDESMV